MTPAGLLAFAGLCVVLAITPGPDTFLVLRFSVTRPAAGMAAAAGSAIGALVWALAVALGLAALLEQSAELYRVVKIIGGLYLVYLGIAAFVASRRRRAQASHAADEAPARRTSLGSGFLAGALSTMLNPKVGLFFLAVAPQFVPHDGSMIGSTLLLGATYACIGSAYLVTVALLAGRAVAWLKRPSVTTWLERISAGILAALGLGTIALSVE